MIWKKPLFLVLFVLTVSSAVAQNSIDDILKPADSLNVARRNAVVITQTALAASTLVALNELWYADYPKSKFHFINDNADWYQMDKIGHVFSSYHLGSIGKNTLQWSGVSRKNQLIYGATLGFAFLSVVEVFDGYSSEWGASTGDILANASGTALFVSQELLWKEQRIIPKFSFHTTRYASMRPEILGSTTNEQILKDYNGQTYWLSFNVNSFFKTSGIPKWLNVAVGHGAEGMINGNGESENGNFQHTKRYRQYYLSLDLDLTKIETKSRFLKTVFYVFNCIKIPAPTVEIRPNNRLKWHLVYF